ncbi:acyl-CoA thioesterase [bacterium]|nr:acyl-CoA thioesterase [bacterium]
MAAQFVIRRRVEFFDTDMAGIIHFSSYYRYMEEAEHAFFRSLGLSVMQKRDDGVVVGWPRVSASCSFEAPARFEDELEIRVSVERKGVKSLTMRYEFFNGERRVAHGRMKIACCLCRHDAPLESIPIPPEYDREFQEEQGANNE